MGLTRCSDLPGSARSEAVGEPDVDDVHGVRDGAEIDRPLRPIADVAVLTLLRAVDRIARIARRSGERANAGRSAVFTLELLHEHVSVAEHDLEGARLLPGPELHAVRRAEREAEARAGRE